MIFWTFFESLEFVLISMVVIFIMSEKLATLSLFKIKVFWNKGYDTLISSMVRKFDNSSISMREFIITSILEAFDQKKHFFKSLP